MSGVVKIVKSAFGLDREHVRIYVPCAVTMKIDEEIDNKKRANLGIAELTLNVTKNDAEFLKCTPNLLLNESNPFFSIDKKYPNYSNTKMNDISNKLFVEYIDELIKEITSMFSDPNIRAMGNGDYIHYEDPNYVRGVLGNSANIDRIKTTVGQIYNVLKKSESLKKGLHEKLEEVYIPEVDNNNGMRINPEIIMNTLDPIYTGEYNIRYRGRGRGGDVIYSDKIRKFANDLLDAIVRTHNLRQTVFNVGSWLENYIHKDAEGKELYPGRMGQNLRNYLNGLKNNTNENFETLRIEIIPDNEEADDVEKIVCELYVLNTVDGKSRQELIKENFEDQALASAVNGMSQMQHEAYVKEREAFHKKRINFFKNLIKDSLVKFQEKIYNHDEQGNVIGITTQSRSIPSLPESGEESGDKIPRVINIVNDANVPDPRPQSNKILICRYQASFFKVHSGVDEKFLPIFELYKEYMVSYHTRYFNVGIFLKEKYIDLVSRRMTFGKSMPMEKNNLIIKNEKRYSNRPTLEDIVFFYPGPVKFDYVDRYTKLNGNTYPLIPRCILVPVFFIYLQHKDTKKPQEVESQEKFYPRSMDKIATVSHGSGRSAMIRGGEQAGLPYAGRMSVAEAAALRSQSASGRSSQSEEGVPLDAIVGSGSGLAEAGAGVFVTSDASGVSVASGTSKTSNASYSSDIFGNPSVTSPPLPENAQV